MFGWSEDFTIGIDEIDIQHKEIFNKIDEIKIVLDKEVKDKKELINVIDKTIEYAVYHLHFEEEFMDAKNYFDYSEHKKKHKDFINFLRNIKYDDIKVNKFKFCTDILDFITMWLSRHIIIEDKKYKDFLDSKSIEKEEISNE